MSRAAQLSLASMAEPTTIPKPDPRGEYGEVFTRRWVVELILDAVGYRADADLGGMTIVEPACGRGAFLLPIVERLARSCARHGRHLADAGDAIRGFDLLMHNVEHVRKEMTAKLLELGEPLDVAEHLSDGWATAGDFLLTGHGRGQADFVVGNPPYRRYGRSDRRFLRGGRTQGMVRRPRPLAGRVAAHPGTPRRTGGAISAPRGPPNPNPGRHRRGQRMRRRVRRSGSGRRRGKPAPADGDGGRHR